MHKLRGYLIQYKLQRRLLIQQFVVNGSVSNSLEFFSPSCDVAAQITKSHFILQSVDLTRHLLVQISYMIWTTEEQPVIQQFPAAECFLTHKNNSSEHALSSIQPATEPDDSNPYSYTIYLKPALIHTQSSLLSSSLLIGLFPLISQLQLYSYDFLLAFYIHCHTPSSVQLPENPTVKRICRKGLVTTGVC